MRIIRTSLLLLFALSIGTLGLFAAPLSEAPKQPEVQIQSSNALVTLTLNFNAEGEGYQYAYTQRFTQKPGTNLRLPSRSSIRFSPRYIGFLAGFSDGKTTYLPGDTIEMPDSDVTLSALFEQGTLFSDPEHNIDFYTTDEALTVPQVSLAEDDPRIFVGWYDRQSNTILTDSTYQRTANGVFFEPVYKEIRFTHLGLTAYNQSAVPTNTALTLAFAYRNQGNLTLKNIKATLSGDNRIQILDPQPGMRTLRGNEASYQRSFFGPRAPIDAFTFIIDKSVPSGTEIPLTLTLTDEDGDTFTTSLSLTVK